MFNEDAGFRLLVGQNEEFPLLQVKYIAKAKLSIYDDQARHIPLSPGKRHSVEVSGSRITTSKNPKQWRFEGNPIFPMCAFFTSIISGLLKLENLAPTTRGCRFAWEADSLTLHSR